MSSENTNLIELPGAANGPGFQPVEPSPAKLEKLNFYRAEIKHEFARLSDRVSSYVTSQSFLCIAFAGAMGNLNPVWGKIFTLVFPVALALLGIVTSLRAELGIAAAIDTIALWHVKQNKLFLNDPAMEDYRIQRPGYEGDPEAVDKVHQRSLAFARWSPRVFLIAWIAFGTLAVMLHFFTA